MDDRFKFRAWDKASNKMYDVQSFHTGWLPDGYHKKQRKDPTYKDWMSVTVWDFDEDPSSTRVCKPIELDKVTLIQSTAKRDRGNKLIFEGDRVVLNHHQGGSFEAVVKWADVGFYLKPLDQDNWCEDWTLRDDHNRFEIIGNIYQDKEIKNV